MRLPKTRVGHYQIWQSINPIQPVMEHAWTNELEFSESSSISANQHWRLYILPKIYWKCKFFWRECFYLNEHFLCLAPQMELYNAWGTHAHTHRETFLTPMTNIQRSLPLIWYSAIHFCWFFSLLLFAKIHSQFNSKRPQMCYICVMYVCVCEA